MSREANKYEIQLLDTLIVLARNKMLILKIVVSITLISLVISFVWPKSYKSSAIILPPAQQQGFSGLAGMLGGMLPVNLGSGPQINPEAILTILNSRSLRVELINAFDLQDVYSNDVMEILLIMLNENIRIEDTREGGFGFNPISSIKLSVTDREPERAKEMAAFMVRRLDEMINDINRKNAFEQFEMIEQRYQRNLAEMETSEQAFMEFQETYGIIEIEEQAKAVIETLAEIKARSIETEMAINVMRQTVGDENSELRRLLRTKTELDRQYQQLVERSDAQAREANIIPPILDIPGLALQYYRLYREVTVQNKIYENLYPQYDFQKMMLGAEKRGIQILDEPHLPTYKDKPKRAFIVLGGLVFSLFFSMLLVFYRHTMETGKTTGSEQYQKMLELQNQFRIPKKDDTSGKE